MRNLLDEHGYSSDKDFSLKRKIQESIQKHFQMYEEFILNKPSIVMNVHNHFQEIRFKLDERREIIKENIDDIYMEMIEKTKNFEKLYFKSLEDNLNASLKSFETHSIEQSLKETDDKFRRPNLLI